MTESVSQKNPAKKTKQRRRVLMALGYYDAQLHTGIVRYAQEAGWVLDTSMAHYGSLPDHWHGDGIIAIFVPKRQDLAQFVRRQSIPTVALYDEMPNLRVPRVVLDDERIGALAAEHLLERGFQNLGFCRFTDAVAVERREMGFRHAVEQAGKNYFRLDWQAASRRRANHPWFDWLRDQLRRLPLPVGLMAQSDHRATYLLGACEDANLAVPEQVAIVGVDNDETTCRLAPIPLTSVDANREWAAYEAARLLDRLLDGEPVPEAPRIIPAKGIVVRQSSDIYAIPDRAVARALSFIRNRLAEPISVEDVIRASQTSRCGLYRAFEKHLNRSIGDEIDRQRAELAKSLLAESNEKLYRIARAAGFSGPEHFVRVFRRVTGETPSSFRRHLAGS